MSWLTWRHPDMPWVATEAWVGDVFPDGTIGNPRRVAGGPGDRLSAPVIFFQGAEDRVVPPNQTELMVAALKERGVPVGYFLFDGEQHGFRKAENIRRALDGELYFYAMLILRSGLRF